MKLSSSSAFTLIELLVVIAIIAILAVVVVLTLNPAQMLAQSRDANRLADLATMNSAINLYNTDQSGTPTYSLGTPSTTYISIADPAATSTLGTNCSTMGLPATTTGWTDQCPASSTLRSVNGQGWLPVNFSKISAGTPFGSLPIDPTNNTSSLLYYTYAMNGSTYEITVPLESQKYLKQDLLVSNTDPARQAIGNNPSLISQEEGLVGYWNLDEGSGSSTIDQSGNANNGTWAGTATGTSGYYSPGKVGAWAGTLNGSNDFISVPNLTQLINTSFTINGWMYVISQPGYYSSMLFVTASGVSFSLFQTSLVPYVQIYNGSSYNAGACSIAAPLNTWVMLSVVYNNSSQSYSIYYNGAQCKANASVPGGMYSGYNATAEIGAYAGNYHNGYIDDVRIYNRALSVAEVQEIYNAEK